jgi:electron transport complex protein RnfG
MSRKSKSSGFLAPVVTLVAIASVSAAVLGLVHQVTLQPIQEAENAKELAAIAEVTDEFDNNPFEEQRVIQTKNKKHKLTMYPARKDGKLHSVAIKTYTNTGFGGRIDVIAGFNVDGSIKTFKVISASETPGLGAKIDEPKFKEQFNGFHPRKQILKVRQDGGDVDAVTAATISSRAVLRALSRAFDALNHFNSEYENEE